MPNGTFVPGFSATQLKPQKYPLVGSPKRTADLIDDEMKIQLGCDSLHLYQKPCREHQSDVAEHEFEREASHWALADQVVERDEEQEPVHAPVFERIPLACAELLACPIRERRNLLKNLPRLCEK